MAGNWYLELAARNKGRDAFVDNWVVEKLAQVVGGVAEAWESVGYSAESGDAPNLHSGLYQAYRNACKLASWLAGNTSAYSEVTAEEAFAGGREAMAFYIEELLNPILE